MDLKVWNRMQMMEAFSAENRYYFWLKNKRGPKNDDELVMFYAENGGAKDFAIKHERERGEKSTSSQSQE